MLMMMIIMTRVSKFCKKYQISLCKIAAGGFHNLALTSQAGQILAWGSGAYGQLGHGNQFDDGKPRLINDIKDVTEIAAGLRHSFAIRVGATIDLLGWGYNAYGELGVGDTNIRIQPTKLTAMTRGKLLGISCGDRHTVALTSHRPMRAREDVSLKPYFAMLEVRQTVLQLVRPSVSWIACIYKCLCISLACVCAVLSVPCHQMS